MLNAGCTGCTKEPAAVLGSPATGWVLTTFDIAPNCFPPALPVTLIPSSAAPGRADGAADREGILCLTSSIKCSTPFFNTGSFRRSVILTSPIGLSGTNLSF